MGRWQFSGNSINVRMGLHFISLSRNFGKEAALYAGLQAAQGDFVATMDVDLQDHPSLLPQPPGGPEGGATSSLFFCSAIL